MLKKLLIIALFIFPLSQVRAADPPDEGMWMPFLISQNFEEMQKLGLRITPDQIYSVNKSSLKDAIVHFGGFCTGEIISDQGLILTNHHCGYDAIQTLSSTTNNYLRDGFWAKTKADEMPSPGLFVRFLVRMEDVTKQVEAEAGTDYKDAGRAAKIQAAYKKITDEAVAGTKYTAKVQPMYNGGEHYLFVYETYNDVRLVGTPPESIGKYGGDTDNWMWPRHTGDFSMFRVYADKDGKPAEYSKDNVPLKPKHFLPVSIKNLKEGEFAMVFGYPGRTQRYLTSEDIKVINDYKDPLSVKIREKRLAIMKADMDADPKIDLMYASKYARVANYWKKWKGEMEGFIRMNTVEVKQQQEAEFNQWVNADAKRKEMYGGVVENLNKLIVESRSIASWGPLLNEALFGSDLMPLAWSAHQLEEALTLKPGEKKPNDEAVKATVAQLREIAKEIYRELNAPTDQKLMAETNKFLYEKLEKSQHPKILTETQAKFKGDWNAFAANVYAKSLFATEKSFNDFLNAPNLKKLQKDPLYAYVVPMIKEYREKIAPKAGAIAAQKETLYLLYIKGMRQMNPGKKFYPDANSTMRLTYGSVKPYAPADAVQYDYLTYLEGVIQKKNNDDPEFVVPDKLVELYKKKDFGRYAQNGKLPVCFLTTNDITGGNSGSPVINGDGHLIGLAFDGNWEAMTGDFVFEPPIQRTISVDIRYVLFIIDKFAGAKHIVDEMKVME